MLQVEGAGFDDSVIVTICDLECEKQEVNSTHITCLTPKSSKIFFNKGIKACNGPLEHMKINLVFIKRIYAKSYYGAVAGTLRYRFLKPCCKVFKS